MKNLVLFLAITFAAVTHVTAQDRFKEVSSTAKAETAIDSVNYSNTMSVLFSDSLGFTGNFAVDTVVLLSNYQTGFAVDSIRAKAIEELIDRVNGN